MNTLQSKKQKVEAVAKRREVFFDTLRRAAEAEHHLGKCGVHIALLIDNGKIREKFYKFVDSAKVAEEELYNIFKREGYDFRIKSYCEFCRLKPESFSLEGAINLSVEIIEVTIKCYRKLIRFADKKNRSLFTKFLKEKLRHRNALIKEKHFNHNKGKGGVIEDFCLPYVISKLWR